MRANIPEEILLDVCGLEPPEPFERATETLRGLLPGQYLKLVIPRRPRLLYPWMEEHGFLETTREVAEDQFAVYIWRADDQDCGAVITDLLRA